MIAIITKVLPYTDKRGTRIVATAPCYTSKKITVGWNHGLNTVENHENAALDFWACYGENARKLVGSAYTSADARVHLFDSI